MAYYRGHQDAVVHSVVATRGEGGQNEAGPELYERLGAIRTAETEAAARVLGTHVVYLDRYDFGFSKHAAETFAEWSAPRAGFWEPRDGLALDADAGRDALVADVVRLVRRYKPDVLFTNHDTTTAWPDAQHGHHQALGIAAYRAFSLAADASYHPEQLGRARRRGVAAVAAVRPPGRVLGRRPGRLRRGRPRRRRVRGGPGPPGRAVRRPGRGGGEPARQPRGSTRSRRASAATRPTSRCWRPPPAPRRCRPARRTWPPASRPTRTRPTSTWQPSSTAGACRRSTGWRRRPRRSSPARTST